MSIGLEIAEQGVSLDTAADYQKVLDSRWSIMEVFDEVNIDTTIVANSSGFHNNIVYSHNFGRLAAFEFYPDPSTAITRSPDQFGFRALPSGYTNDVELDVQSDMNNIYVGTLLPSGQPTYNLSVKGLLRIYSNDITKEFKAPTYSINGSSQSTSNVGLQIIKPGNRMGDNGMDKYNLNTNAKSLNIQKTGLQVASGGLLTITHDAGYRPTYYISFRNDHTTVFAYTDPFQNTSTLLPLLDNISYATADAHTITMRGAQAGLNGTYAYVILKDPVELGI